MSSNISFQTLVGDVLSAIEDNDYRRIEEGLIEMYDVSDQRLLEAYKYLYNHGEITFNKQLNDLNNQSYKFENFKLKGK